MKHVLSIELSNSTQSTQFLLQNIKDAMAHAIMQKIETTGIQDAQDCHFSVWQSIYLQAHFQQCIVADPLLQQG